MFTAFPQEPQEGRHGNREHGERKCIHEWINYCFMVQLLHTENRQSQKKDTSWKCHFAMITTTYKHFTSKTPPIIVLTMNSVEHSVNCPKLTTLPNNIQVLSCAENLVCNLANWSTGETEKLPWKCRSYSVILKISYNNNKLRSYCYLL